MENPINKKDIGRPEIAEFLNTARTFNRQVKIFIKSNLTPEVKNQVDSIVRMMNESINEYTDQSAGQ